jgi:hypothetical protein
MDVILDRRLRDAELFCELTIAQIRRYQNRDLTLARGQCREQRSSGARSGRAAHHDQWKTEVLYRIKIMVSANDGSRRRPSATSSAVWKSQARRD